MNEEIKRTEEEAVLGAAATTTQQVVVDMAMDRVKTNTPTAPPPPFNMLEEKKGSSSDGNSDSLLNYDSYFYSLDCKACEYFYITETGLIGLALKSIVKRGDVFYFPGKFDKKEFKLAFNYKFKDAIIPMFFEFKDYHIGTLHFSFFLDSIEMFSSEWEPINFKIKYNYSARCHELVSFRLENFKESCYYIRKSTEDALKALLSSKNFYEVEFSENWMNFTLSERERIRKHCSMSLTRAECREMFKNLNKIMKAIEKCEVNWNRTEELFSLHRLEFKI